MTTTPGTGGTSPRRRRPTAAQRMAAADTEHQVQGADDLLIPHEFEETLEHLRLTKAIVVLTLHRPTGQIDIDDEMCTPAELVYMLDHNREALKALALEDPYEDA